MSDRTAIVHPLGRGALAGQQRTQENRRAVASCLYLYFDGRLVKQINRRQETLAGRELTDRMVSHLEIASALTQLRRERPGLALMLEWRFADGWTQEAIARGVHRHKSTVAAEIDEALNLLIDRIFHDTTQRSND